MQQLLRLKNRFSAYSVFFLTFIIADDIVQCENKKEDNSVTKNVTSFDHINGNAFATAETIHQDQHSKSIALPIDEHPITIDITPCKNLSLFFNLTLRSLGVIFGDIGTSPLYVLSTIFYYQPSEAQCIGAVSLIVWSLIVAVSIKYGIFILMADNHGECGTFALCGLLTSENSLLSPKTKKMIIVLSLLAGSLLLGDGALTPAVSVLSAVEGVAVEAPKLHNWIVPITVVILVLLFLAQRWGTSKIGVMFGPIMCL
ncbi:unnamed protein product [Rotaria sp. Silwood2]|nr:unnamed protein product [Rotaria sp. Silwood2]